ncbi:hypothetical protein [Spirosoma sp.]|uniref:hypothetical protein n=1 Tax=Spirosoma sp. TaxID=1899569 RepID=UPI0026192462|nr:hypothetical protein [Spirosoma sp.]MCX6215359.1 hypothetical protein [Spirosoma sp.]
MKSLPLIFKLPNFQQRLSPIEFLLKPSPNTTEELYLEVPTSPSKSNLRSQLIFKIHNKVTKEQMKYLLLKGPFAVSIDANNYDFIFYREGVGKITNSHSQLLYEYNKEQWETSILGNKYIFCFNEIFGDLTISFHLNTYSSNEELKKALISINDKKDPKPNINVQTSNEVTTCIYEFSSENVNYLLKTIQNGEILCLLTLSCNKDTWSMLREFLLTDSTLLSLYRIVFTISAGGYFPCRNCKTCSKYYYFRAYWKLIRIASRVNFLLTKIQIND